MSAADDFWGEEAHQSQEERVAANAPAPSAKLNKRQFNVPTHDESGTPLTKRAQTGLRQAAQGRSDRSIRSAAVKRRNKYEAANPERFKDITDLASDHYRGELAKRGMSTEGGKVEAGVNIGMTKTQIYRSTDAGAEAPHGPGMDETPLPGLEHPDAVKDPARWEDLSKRTQLRAAASIKQRTGADQKSMGRQFGAQLDQGVWRAHMAGASKPYSRDFYVNAPSRARIKETADKTGASFGLVAAVNAHTSPNMEFHHIDKGTGKESFPNAERAEHIIRHSLNGGLPEDYSADSDAGGAGPLKGGARSGYPKNFTKAAKTVDAVTYGGKSLADTGGFGPKTGAYHNALLGSVPNKLVADRWTGGEGMLTHLDDTGVDSEGNKAKSEQEKGLEVTHIHSMMDAGARHELKQRGLGKINPAQATQWGEARVQGGKISHDDAYPSQAKAPLQTESMLNSSNNVTIAGRKGTKAQVAKAAAKVTVHNQRQFGATEAK